MQLGKQLPFSRHTVPAANGEQLKRCSPLAFSSLFNDDFFLRYFDNTAEKEIGVTTNQENLALTEYSKGGCGILNLGDSVVQQYNIFETNGKFTLPFFLLEEIFSELPERGYCYVYFLNVFSSGNELHKQIVIQSKDYCYLIDSSNTNVIIFEHQEYINSNYVKRLTNLSVLMSIHERKFIFGTEGYDINLFKHLI